MLLPRCLHSEWGRNNLEWLACGFLAVMLFVPWLLCSNNGYGLIPVQTRNLSVNIGTEIVNTSAQKVPYSPLWSTPIPFSIEELKQFSSKQLAQIVLNNCRLLSRSTKNDSIETNVQKMLALRQKHLSMYTVNSVNQNAKYTVCTNTKTGGTFLQFTALNAPMYRTKPQRIKAFAAIREPMHRLLSAYLDKFALCEPKICSAWVPFYRNIARFVTEKGRIHSKLYNLKKAEVTNKDVSFVDFIDYIIFEYLSNDGVFQATQTEIKVTNWVWMHWNSPVRHCHMCSVPYQHIVLFENMNTTLYSVYQSYPDMFRNSVYPDVKTSETSSKLREYYDVIPDHTLHFLGRVMYGLDYEVLPYDFGLFCQSIGRIC